ncbi:hypothetical protein SISSUDRAFT_1067294 [Sistotremastrum suecicum HHB10207 ss-3]|uniref:HECT domain-containing protein n=1 Tax=Sistotremastrum suecicum HHB10207 ss-3 TaxID=1314776 RepID=A0A165X9X0_9AGAM|nr:hypothetical protein SISSUDRAFT_1067294 [Sistotremastrum suecicum HHB10207 ss-3]
MQSEPDYNNMTAEDRSSRLSYYQNLLSTVTGNPGVPQDYTARINGEINRILSSMITHPPALSQSGTAATATLPSAPSTQVAHQGPAYAPVATTQAQAQTTPATPFISSQPSSTSTLLPAFEITPTPHISQHSPAIPSPLQQSPIIAAYQSGLVPHTPGTAASPSTPLGMGLPAMLGLAQGSPQARSRANTARLAHASASSPVAVAAGGASVRRRGPARVPPSLASPEPGPSATGTRARASSTSQNRANMRHGVSIDNCRVFLGGMPHVRLRIKISFPVKTPGGRFQLREDYNQSLNDELIRRSLLADVTLPTSTPITVLYQFAESHMRSSQWNYEFSAPATGLRIVESENHPFILAKLHDRGVTRARGNPRSLTAYTGKDVVIIDHLLNDVTGQFNRLPYSVDGPTAEKRFVVWLIVKTYPLKARLQIDGVLSDDSHRCATDRWWDFVNGTRLPDEELTSSESEADDDKDEEMEVAQAITIPEPEPELAATTTSPIPSAIWDEDSPFVPPTAPYSDDDFEGDKFSERVYKLAVENNPNRLALVLEAPTIEELGARLLDLVRETASSEEIDCSLLLTPSRYLSLTNSGSSTGPGVAREAIESALAQALKHPMVFAVPIQDKHCSLFLAFPQDKFAIPVRREQELITLGILCALSVIEFGTPGPFGPSLLRFIFHNHNLHSLSPLFILTFYPPLYKQLMDWRSIGPNGDIKDFKDHFLAYHNCTIAPYENGRTQEEHDVLGRDILCIRTIGMILGHPELLAFSRGFSLPLANKFSWFEAVHSVEGGSLRFLKELYALPSLDNIIERIDFWDCDHLIVKGWTVKGIIKQFLFGFGLPCPELFRLMAEQFDIKVDYERVSSRDFRVRLFCQALMGRITFSGPGKNMMICLYTGPEDTSSNYGGLKATEVEKEAYAAQGKISYQTCGDLACLPQAFIEGLGAATYDGIKEPKDFSQALDHWLFCELLQSVGHYTTL